MRWASYIASLVLSHLAVAIRLFPLTIAKIGARDAASIMHYAPHLAVPAAALGLLFILRYVIPRWWGFPFFGSYLATARRLRQQRI